MHIHHAPDPRVERRMVALQLTLQAKKVGMRAIVLDCIKMSASQQNLSSSRNPETASFASVSSSELLKESIELRVSGVLG